MDVAAIDAEIASTEAEVRTRKERQEEMACQYTAAMKEFIEGWVPKVVDETVLADPLKVKAAGPERLGQLKRHLQEFVEQLPLLVETTLSDPKYWPHRAERPTGSIHGRAHSGVLFVLQEHVGKLLQEHGFAPDGHRWKVAGGQSVPGYCLHTALPAEMEQLTERYVQENEALAGLGEKLSRLRKAKVDLEARSLWDSA